MKRIVALVLVLGILAGSFSIGTSAASVKPGLRVTGMGTVMLGNEMYYGYGLNLFSTFQYHLDCYYHYGDALDNLPRKYIDDLAMCKKYNLQYVRMPFTCWGWNGYKLFDEDRETFFLLLDDIVEEAERQQIGIIASLLWNPDTLPYYVGEKRSQMGNPHSKTVAFAKEYVAAIVRRYKDSPAIWGWEVGNEYNLVADLCSRDYTAHLPHEVFKVGEWNNFDFYTSVEMQTYYRIISETVRKYDSYRLMTNGNGEMRSSSYHMNQTAQAVGADHIWNINWTGDTYEQFIDIVRYHTPEPMDTHSFHYQAVRGKNFLSTMNVGGDTCSLREAFSWYVQASRTNGLAAFFGEFGDFIELEESASPEQIQEKFRSLVVDMVASDLQLACAWLPWSRESWEKNNDRDRFLHCEEGLDDYSNRYKVTLLGQVNEAFAAADKQDVDAYWAAFSDTPTTTTTNATKASPTGKTSAMGEASVTTTTVKPAADTTTGTVSTGSTGVPAPTTATTGDGTTDTRGKDTATIGTTAPTTGTAADADSLPEGAKTWIYWAVGVAILLLAGGGAVWLIIKKKA